jgi:predicted metal-dependent HD superfamily phosphohydrolase
MDFRHSIIGEQFVSLAPSGEKAAPAFERLAVRYHEKHRRYHNFSHIQAGFREYQKFFEKAMPRNPFFAWAYHDAIYDPRASDNEERSAALFMEDSRELGIGIEDADHVAMMILTTTYKTNEGNIVTDMDLSGLGQPPDVYDNNVLRIRLEYDFVDNATWRTGRAAVLNQFLTRSPLYHTREFAAAYTAQAHENIKRELAGLA